MDETLEHLESLHRRYHDQLQRLNVEMADLIARRPATTAADARISDEQAVAARIDQLQQLTAHRRLDVRIRPSQRAAHREELQQLLAAHPQLADPAQRQGRWEQILRQADNQDHRNVEALRDQIGQVQAQQQENTETIEACSTERQGRARHYEHLNAAIDGRVQTAPHYTTRPATPPEAPDAVEPNPDMQPHLPPPDIEPPTPSGPSITP